MNKFRFFIASILLMIPAVMFSQMKVSGTVTEAATGEPLPGVNIQIVGTSQGTTSDFDGNFILDNVKKGSVLEFSYVGFETQNVTVASAMINVAMKEDAQALDEVVIIGYGTTTKKDATGSVASITEKDFDKTSITTPASLISGRVSGVTITTDGSPGGGSAIRIRGGSSLNASNDPLIVIDGLPLTNSTTGGSRSVLSSINSNDIESMTVLKDASATAIYGSRASNGVIIITTKKGKSAFFANYNIKTGYETFAKKIDVFSADEFRQLIAERVAAGQSGMSLDQLGEANTDWQKEILQNALSVEQDFSIGGAITEKLPARLSLGFTTQPGIIKTSNFNRGNVGLALNPNLWDDHLKININANLAYEQNRFEPGGVLSAAVNMDPTQPIYDENSPYGGYFEYYQSNGLPAGGNRNPVANINQFSNTSFVHREYGNVEFDYKLHFLPDLRFVLNLGLDHSKGKGKSIRSAESIQGFQLVSGGQTTLVGSESNYTSKRENKLLDSYFNYKKDINNMGLDLTAGYSYQSFTAESFSSGELKDPTHESDVYTEPEIRLIGFFGRANLTFNDKYLLTLSYRKDGSSRFSADNRWGNFPAVAFAWNIGDEKFINSKAISNLKLRLGWGITGQQDIEASYAYLGRYVTGNNVSQYYLGGTSYPVGLPQYINQNIKWEETTTYNVGLDYGLFDDRVKGSLEVYQKESKDLLSNAPVPDGSNYSNYGFQNIGTFESKGIEFSIMTDIIKKENITWDVNYNVNLIDTNIKELALGQDVIHGSAGIKTGDAILIHSQGFAPDSFYMYRQLYDTDGHPIEGAVVDLNQDGVINSDDQYIYQKPAPDVTMGLQSSFNYKNFDLSVSFRASIGNYVYNGMAAKSTFDRLVNQTGLANITTYVNKTGFVSAENDKVYKSDYFIENASFLKMDNVTLGYAFKNFTNGIDNVRLWGGIQNVMTYTKYTGMDPEIFNGIDNTIYPRPRTFLLGLNVKF